MLSSCSGTTRTSSAKRYPLPGTVTTYWWSCAVSPRALRSMNTLRVRLDSSTKVSGQTALISWSFETISFLWRTKTNRTWKVLGVRGTGSPRRSTSCLSGSRRKGPNSYNSLPTWPGSADIAGTPTAEGEADVADSIVARVRRQAWEEFLSRVQLNLDAG